MVFCVIGVVLVCMRCWKHFEIGWYPFHAQTWRKNEKNSKVWVGFDGLSRETIKMIINGTFLSEKYSKINEIYLPDVQPLKNSKSREKSGSNQSKHQKI